MSGVSYLVLVFVLATKTIESGVPTKIPLTLYYESQCPDSRKFILNELKPALKLLHDYFKLTFIPFGKAHSIDESEFKCQHGPTECRGNMVQSCTLHFMEEYGATDLQMLNYVICEMKSEAGARGSLRCVRKAHLDDILVSSCMSSGLGTKLLLQNEFLTDLVKPRFIPTITIDDTFNQQIQDSAMQDLPGTLCSYFKDIPPCAQRYNEMAMQELEEQLNL